MTSKEEAEKFVQRAWEVVWTADKSAILEFYTEDAVICGFTPPKQTYWTGVDAISAHFEELKPMMSVASFNITNLDEVKDSTALYATWNATFDLKIPGLEGVMPGEGIVHILRKEGKITQWIMYEDPTPFVDMALKGQLGPGPTGGK